MGLLRNILNAVSSHPRVGRLLAIVWFVTAAFAVPSMLRAGEPETATRANYGRTPDTVIPYRSFREPYLRFFQEPPTFRGTGRSAPAREPGAVVRIGLLAPGGSAADADLGQEMIDGVTLAIEQANASGGYNGTPFATVLRRDSGAWGSTANEMVGFRYQDDVVGVIGSIDGASTHIALRVALKTQLPMLNTATTDPTLTETAIPWIMRCMADDRQQGYALAHHIFAERGIKKVAAFRVNDRYGRTGIAEFRDAARRLRHPLRVELRWERGDRDFSKQLDRIVRTNAEAVVLWGNAADTAAIVREMQQRKMPQLVFGCDRLVSRRFLTEAGSAADGVVAVAAFNPKRVNPRYAEFYTTFQDRFDKEPGTFAAHAYDGANIMIDCVRKGALNRVSVRDALYAYRRYDGVTGEIEFDTTLNDIGPVYMATVIEGSYVYQRAEFTKTAHASRSTPPYRTLSESPPIARVAQAFTADHKQKVLRIGCFLPLDAHGQAVARGLDMALADATKPHVDAVRIELVVRDSRGTWGDDSSALTSLVMDDGVLALVGSTERRGTHLMETLVAKLHVPLITLCSDDPTIHTIPLPWVFSVAPPAGVIREDFVDRFEKRFNATATPHAAMGYDAGTLLINAIRENGTTRVALRKNLAAALCDECASGSFYFDGLGRRVDRMDSVLANPMRAVDTGIPAMEGKTGGERSLEELRVPAPDGWEED